MSRDKTITIRARKVRSNVYEVDGVIIYADTKQEAIRKWTRARKECER